MQELVVRNGVCEFLGVDAVGRTDAGNADGVRAYSEGGFHVLRVHHQAHEVVAVTVESEEHADSHIIDSSGTRAVHRFRMPSIIALGAEGMQRLVLLFVVSLLKQDVGADPRLLEFAVVLHRGRGDIYVHAADVAVLMVNAVDRLDGLEHIFDRAFNRMLAGFQGEALVAHVLQGDHLFADFFLREFLAGYALVLRVIRAVHAAVDAVVGQIERGEHHDAVAVEAPLDVLGQFKDLVHEIRFVAVKQDGGLAV